MAVLQTTRNYSRSSSSPSVEDLESDFTQFHQAIQKEQEDEPIVHDDSALSSSPLSSYTQFLKTYKSHLLIALGILVVIFGVVFLVIIALKLSSGGKPPHPGGDDDDIWRKNLKKSVFLFSIDGFRWDYIHRFPQKTINLQKVASSGVRAEKMIPSFPTRTFPNHYTLVTGKYPASHGILNNGMYNKENRKYFTMSNTETVWWQGGEPIWITVEKCNFSSSTVFWPGSNVELQGIRPKHYQPIYDDNYGDMNKIDLLMKYLDSDKASQNSSESFKPNLLYASYFSGVDHSGHATGPLSSETEESIAAIDSVLGYFFAELQKRSINPFEDVNIVIVSDHGMSQLNKSCEIDMNDIIAPEDMKKINIVSKGPFVEITALNRDPKSVNPLIDRLFIQLKHREEGLYTVYKPNELPDRLHYNQAFTNFPERAADLVISVLNHCWMATSFVPSLHGDHGYDNKYEDDMGALFVASGPKIARIKEPVTSFSNIHLYPLLASVMELNENMLPQIDGSLDPVKHLLNATASNR